MLKWLKKLRCKLVSCCGSKCTINIDDSENNSNVNIYNAETRTNK